MSEPTEVPVDPEAAEDFAAEVGVDPTQEEIDHYRQWRAEPASWRASRRRQSPSRRTQRCRSPPSAERGAGRATYFASA